MESTLKGEDILAELLVYGYVRLSRDEDIEKDSLENQKNILKEFAFKQGFKITHIFEDDNVSGYSFDRDGLNSLLELIKRSSVDVLLVKDLSRIGRNNAKTLMFLDTLKDYDVKIISITESIDTSNDNDDMLIGIKTWFNELYIKDISKKIKASLHQKQKEGLVIMPPFGYIEDPNKAKTYIIDEEASRTINLIYKLYLDGYGDRKISKYLNEKGYKTPAKSKKDNRGHKGNLANKNSHLWMETTIKRILTNDVYLGILRCGKTKLTGIKGRKKLVSEDEHIIHEGFYPNIIDKETFDLVQQVRNNRIKKNVRAKNEKIHKYAGLLICDKCGKGFVARKLPNGGIVYRCATFHRYGSQECSSHTVNEKDLDDVIFQYLKRLKANIQKNIKELDEFMQKWNKRSEAYDNTIDRIKYQIDQLKNEIKEYSKQLAKHLVSEEIFKELVSDSNANLKTLEENLCEVGSLKEISYKASQGLIKSSELINKTIDKMILNNSQMQMFVKSIIVNETIDMGKYGKPKLRFEFELKEPFSYHLLLNKSLP
jgi:site-specific DNA recombinase